MRWSRAQHLTITSPSSSPHRNNASVGPTLELHTLPHHLHHHPSHISISTIVNPLMMLRVSYCVMVNLTIVGLNPDNCHSMIQRLSIKSSATMIYPRQNPRHLNGLGKLLTSPNTASPQELEVAPREQRNSNLVKSLKVEMGFC